MSLEGVIDSQQKLRLFPNTNSEAVHVVYYQLGTEDLQVVPRESLVPIDNYVRVKRLWTEGVFNLIDIGSSKFFLAKECSERVEKSDRYPATLHWDALVPLHLKGEQGFWVGPLHTCIDALYFIGQVRQQTNPRV